ncbi:hypothetical protein [Litorivivens sp.]|uniref:hypothetical protein n=1 Tax=Litorivivens sp. TaxID=2020868 RepID=UPI003568F484
MKRHTHARPYTKITKQDEPQTKTMRGRFGKRELVYHATKGWRVQRDLKSVVRGRNKINALMARIGVNAGL